ncbi:response regulator transcription factor, partial [Streptomyces olivaceus]
GLADADDADDVAEVPGAARVHAGQRVLEDRGAGESLLSPAATRTLITRFLATPDAEAPLAPPERLTTLTERERQVMSLVAHGMSNTEIAGHLVVSPLTVRSHVQRAMTKLHARDRAQLVVIAYQSGLVRPRP